MRVGHIICIALALTGTARAALQNGIEVIVNDSIITTLHVEDSARDAVQLLRRTYRDPEVLKRKLATTYDEAIQRLVERELILDEFKSSGGAIPEPILDDEVQKEIRQRFNNDRITFIKSLQAQGLTAEIFRERLKEDLIIRYMLQKNIISITVISPAKIEAFYREHMSEFQLGDQVKLRMIIFSVGGAETTEVFARASEVLAKVRNGDAAFIEMAGLYSQGSQKNGDWGWVDQKSPNLKRGLADIAFTLETNKVSNVIGVATDLSGDYWVYQYDTKGTLIRASQYSAKDEPLATKAGPDLGNPPAPPVPPDDFYLMLVEEKQAARVKTLVEVRDEIEGQLIGQERERLRRRWLDRLRQKAFVRFF